MGTVPARNDERKIPDDSKCTLFSFRESSRMLPPLLQAFSCPTLTDSVNSSGLSYLFGGTDSVAILRSWSTFREDRGSWEMSDSRGILSPIARTSEGTLLVLSFSGKVMFAPYENSCEFYYLAFLLQPVLDSTARIDQV